MLKSMKMVKVLSQLTEEYPHGCNVGKYLMVESWRKLWLHFKLGMIQGGIKKWQEKSVEQSQCLMKLWEKYPDLRFGQLVCNIVPENQLFYVEDDIMLERSQDWEKNRR